MAYQINPIAVVKNTRILAEDDNWLQVSSEIVLLETTPSESILGLDTFSHIEVLFLFHLVPEEKIILSAEYPRENPAWPKTGIFAQRKKSRPNRIGSTICKLERISGRSVFVTGLDAIHETPVIDIKPVMKEFLPARDEKITQPDWATELMKDYW